MKCSPFLKLASFLTKRYCACYRKSRNAELLFKDLTKHLNDHHVNLREVPIFKRNVWISGITDSHGNLSNESRLKKHLHLPPGKMITSCGAIFYYEACLTQIGFYCWVNFVGSLDDAKNFEVEFHTANESEKGRESFTYKGSVHTLDEKYCQILEEPG